MVSSHRIGARLVPTAWGIDVTLGTLWDKGKSVFCFMEEPRTDTDLFWDRWHLEIRWPRAKTVVDLHKTLSAFSEDSSSTCDAVLFGHQVILTPETNHVAGGFFGGVSCLEQHIIRANVMYFSELLPRSRTGSWRELKVILCDFVTKTPSAEVARRLTLQRTSAGGAGGGESRGEERCRGEKKVFEEDQEGPGNFFVDGAE
jgi:hypothetical protein